MGYAHSLQNRVRQEPGRLPETTSTRAPSPKHWLGTPDGLTRGHELIRTGNVPRTQLSRPFRRLPGNIICVAERSGRSSTAPAVVPKVAHLFPRTLLAHEPRQVRVVRVALVSQVVLRGPVIAPAELRGHAPVERRPGSASAAPGSSRSWLPPSFLQHLAGSEHFYGTLTRKNILRREGRKDTGILVNSSGSKVAPSML